MIETIYNLLLGLAENCKEIIIPILLIFLIADAADYFKYKAKIYKRLNSIINEIDAEDLVQLKNGEKGDIVKFKK